jgi:hypothetical protein
MSNAQVLHLKNLATKKLRRDWDCPGKLLAHQNLRSHLRPLVTEADNKICGDQGYQAREEATTWLGSENQGEVRGFEQKIGIQWTSELLARLNLTDESSDRP